MMPRFLIIPKEEFVTGIEKCVNNGDDFVESAKNLYAKEMYPSSTFLAYHATEEFAKALLLTDEINGRKPMISKSRWKKVYCNHSKKLRKAEEAIQKNVRTIKETKVTISLDGGIGDLIPEEETITNLSKYSFEAKMNSLYVNYGAYGGTGKWMAPQDNPVVIRQGDANYAILYAQDTRKVVDMHRKNLGI